MKDKGKNLTSSVQPRLGAMRRNKYIRSPGTNRGLIPPTECQSGKEIGPCTPPFRGFSKILYPIRKRIVSRIGERKREGRGLIKSRLPFSWFQTKDIHFVPIKPVGLYNYP